MILLILGLAVFLGVHTLATLRPTRARLVGALGERRYKLAFSLISAIGLALLALGFGQYRAGGYIPIWEPPLWMRHVVIAIMWLAFVMLASAYAPAGRIKGWLRHPMLNAVKTWAFAHLLVNGDQGSIILFTAILLWGGYDRFALKWRGDIGAGRRPDFTRGDLWAVLAGTLGWLAMMLLHPYVIGVPVLFLWG